MGKKNKPTIAEINKANREYWQRANAEFDALVEQSRPLIESPTSVQTLMDFHAEELLRRKEISAKNSAIASKKRTPRKLRASVIEYMRKARQQGMTLQDFLDATGNGSIDGLRIDLIEKRKHPDDNEYLIWLDEQHEEKRFSNTFEGWWAEAGKK